MAQAANAPAAANGASSAPIPSAYAKTHAILQEALRDFDRSLDAQPKSARPLAPPTHGAELLLANSNRGRDLLKPGTMDGVKLELDRFRQLGVEGVTVAVNYPLLADDFPDHEGYLNFFRQVAQEVRSRGMKLGVEALAGSQVATDGTNNSALAAMANAVKNHDGRSLITSTNLLTVRISPPVAISYAVTPVEENTRHPSA